MTEQNAVLEQLMKRQQELQYSAMACALSGQPVPEIEAAEYAALEEMIQEIKRNVPEGSQPSA